MSAMNPDKPDNLNEKAYAFVTDRILLRASGNALAEKIIANTYRRNQFFGTHSHQRTLRHVANAWRYHCEILKACRAGDADGAALWLKRHIASSRRDVLLPLSKV